jgi:hypothetical protein
MNKNNQVLFNDYVEQLTMLCYKIELNILANDMMTMKKNMEKLTTMLDMFKNRFTEDDTIRHEFNKENAKYDVRLHEFNEYIQPIYRSNIEIESQLVINNNKFAILKNFFNKIFTHGLVIIIIIIVIIIIGYYNYKLKLFVF